MVKKETSSEPLARISMREAHEPLIRISKREGITRSQSWLIRIISLLLALLVSGIVIVCIIHINPLKVYATRAS